MKKLGEILKQLAIGAWLLAGLVWFFIGVENLTREDRPETTIVYPDTIVRIDTTIVIQQIVKPESLTIVKGHMYDCKVRGNVVVQGEFPAIISCSFHGVETAIEVEIMEAPTLAEGQNSGYSEAPRPAISTNIIDR